MSEDAGRQAQCEEGEEPTTVQSDREQEKEESGWEEEEERGLCLQFENMYTMAAWFRGGGMEKVGNLIGALVKGRGGSK